MSTDDMPRIPPAVAQYDAMTEAERAHLRADARERHPWRFPSDEELRRAAMPRELGPMQLDARERLQTQPVVVNVTQPAPAVVGPNHVLHAVITLLTGGLWLPVWLIIARRARKAARRG